MVQPTVLQGSKPATCGDHPSYTEGEYSGRLTMRFHSLASMAVQVVTAVSGFSMPVAVSAAALAMGSLTPVHVRSLGSGDGGSSQLAASCVA